MNENNPSVTIPDLGTTIESMNFQLSSAYIWVDDPNKICKINLYTFYAYARRPNMQVKDVTFDITAKKRKTK